MARNPDNWLGQELAGGRYKVTAKLGEGGMGFVYKAHDGNLDTDVVIKVPRLSMLVERQFAQRFTRELRSLVNLSHPHIVKISDVGQQDKIPFAVMQYLSGGDLADRLQDGRVSPDSLSTWLPEIARALDFVHEKGYVHRDIKPGNILFDDQGHAYLSDFGVAKVMSDAQQTEDAQNLTGTGMVLGTADYMAPELIMGKPVDGRIDQYALAITVHEALAGGRPFNGKTPTAVMMAHTSQAAPQLAGVSPQLQEAIHRGLAKEPQQRFGNCREFAETVIAAARVSPAPVKVAQVLSQPEHTAKVAGPATPVSTPRPRPTQLTDTVRQRDESSQVSTSVSPTVGPKPDTMASFFQSGTDLNHAYSFDCN